MTTQTVSTCVPWVTSHYQSSTTTALDYKALEGRKRGKVHGIEQTPGMCLKGESMSHLFMTSEIFLKGPILLGRIVKYWCQRASQNKLRAVLGPCGMKDKSGVWRYKWQETERTAPSTQDCLRCAQLTQGSLRCCALHSLISLYQNCPGQECEGRVRVSKLKQTSLWVLAEHSWAPHVP